MKKILICISVLLIVFTMCGCFGTDLTVYNYDNNILSTLKSDELDLTVSENAYIDIVLDEAAEILSKQQGISVEKATKKLLKDGYSIYTFYNTDFNSYIEKVYEASSKEFNFGCAITDFKGRLLAVYSGIFDDSNSNFAAQKTQPHSTIKPLAVYAPALESGKLNYSTLYEDSPYKKLNASGGAVDWPKNSNGYYYKKKVTPLKAIKESLNTVAVKCLKDYGVNNSIDFLQKNFEINLTYEQNKSTIYGEEEIIGNIALGSIQSGVSPVDMAGFYQIFGNSGKYSKPKTISRICDKDGNEIYAFEEESKQVISKETAYIMNQLLKGVVSTTGTGKEAYIEDLLVVGKTGTANENIGNWFVGVTPQYSCAVWHSLNGSNNYSAEFFSKIVSQIKHTSKVFPYNPNVISKPFCTQSGKLACAKCKSIELGYYVSSNLPEICDEH